MQSQIDGVLRQHLVPARDFIYGFADLRGLVNQEFGEFQYGIVIGKKLDPVIVEKIMEGPTLEYFNHYRSMNADLKRLTVKISEDLNQRGFGTRLVEPSVSTEQLDTTYKHNLRAALSHKMVATRAGLGWIGKTDLFISKKFGPRVRLVTILTQTPLISVSRPINKSRCGTCCMCTDVCPAGAANGILWDTTIDRDQFFDAFKCRRQCAEFGRTRLQCDARVCGICVAVCPIGKPPASIH